MDPHGYTIGFKEHVCHICRLPVDFCICEHIKSISSTVPLRILAHFREYKSSTNTAYYLPLMLQDAQIHLRGLKTGPPEADVLTVEGRTPLCLFAHENSEVLNEEFLATLSAPPSLILLDGSWHQVRRMPKREAALRNVRFVSLPQGAPSSWKQRVAPSPNALSSYEAVARALGIIEGPEVANALMKFFDIMTARWYSLRWGRCAYPINSPLFP